MTDSGQHTENTRNGSDSASRDDRSGSHATRCPANASIILFTRVPIPGKAKTRLEGMLAPAQCAQLQEAMALDAARMLSTICDSIILCYSQDWKDLIDGESMRDRFVSSVRSACDRNCQVTAIEQEGSDLGERMSRAFDAAFSGGARTCLLMGSDLPYATAEDVVRASRLLEINDVVFCPSVDGGYWLVGMDTPFPELFSGKGFGNASVLEDALATCSSQGRHTALGNSTSDIDTPEDFQLLRTRAHAGDHRIGQHVVHFLQLYENPAS